MPATSPALAQAAIPGQTGPEKPLEVSASATTRPGRVAEGAQPSDEFPTGDLEPQEGLDWIAVALGFVAFMAVAGLIPLWILVFQKYFSP